jgi:hypothetical protein
MGGMVNAAHRDWLATYLLAICSIVALAIIVIDCKNRLEESELGSRHVAQICRKIGLVTQTSSCVNGIRRISQATIAMTTRRIVEGKLRGE